MKNSLRLWALCALSCLLAACGGGGGGGGGDKPTPDAAPVVHALASGDVRMDGGVVHATVGGTVVLDASGSTDADGDALTFAWTLTAHPAGSAISTSGSGTTLTWKPDVAGTYTFTVTATDAKGGSSTQQASVAVDNQAPVSSVTVAASFNATPTRMPSQDIVAGGSVVLDATATSDPNGDAVAVSFDLEAPTGSTATLSGSGRTMRLSPDVLGSYVVHVHGTDGRGGSFETDYPFNVANLAPIGNVSVTPTLAAAPTQMASTPVTVGANIVLDATATTDPDGDAVDVTFELSRPAASAATVSVNGRVAHFTPDVLGAYQVRVRGVDSHGASFETRYPFQADNHAPSPVTVASINANVDGGSTLVTTSVGYDVAIDSSSSSDADGNALSRSWSLASVPSGSAATLQGLSTAVSVGLTPDVLGDYVLKLTVTDTLGAKSVRTVTVRANNRRPVAQVTSNATPQSLPNAPGIVVPLGTTVTLRGDASTDADGDTLTYAWFLDTAPAGSHAALSSASSVAPAFTADIEGTYVFRLRVTDPYGAFSERDVILDVGTHPPVAVVDRGTVTILAGAAAHPSAALSYDADGDALTYQWSVDAHPAGSSATLAVTNTAAVSFTPDVPGLYVLAVRVSDGHSTSIAYVNVNALNAFLPSVPLSFVPGAAHYSPALDRVVFGAASPAALHTVDPFTGAQSAIPLPAAIKNFSLSPDGKLAAVLHEGVLTLVDLVNGVVLHSTSTSGSQTESLVTNAGIIYSIGQTGGQWVYTDPVVVIDGRTGVKVPQTVGFGSGEYYGTQYGVLAPSLNKVFFVAQGLSPSTISWFHFDPSTSSVTADGESMVGWSFPMYWPIWMASDDSVVFSESGDYFRADTLAYAGKLSGAQGMFAFVHSAADQEADALVGAPDGAYPTSYLRFTGPFLLPDTSISWPTIGGQPAYGLNIFRSASGARVVLVQQGSNGIDGHAVTGYSLIAN